MRYRFKNALVFYLWRIRGALFRIHDHDPGGCTCGCPVIGCYGCSDYRRVRKPVAADTSGSEQQNV